MEFKLDDVVIDDLTDKPHTITEIRSDRHGNMCYRIDSDYLDGLRYPWELTEPEVLDDIN